jgi:hypothetical protein
VNAVLRGGAIEAVSDEGAVTLRLPGGACEVVQIPLEHVSRIRSAQRPKRGAP